MATAARQLTYAQPQNFVKVESVSGYSCVRLLVRCQVREPLRHAWPVIRRGVAAQEIGRAYFQS